MRGENIIIFGALGRSPAECHRRATTQEKAGSSVKCKPAQAARVAPFEYADIRCASSAADLPISEWEAAFPGQSVCRGHPNRVRLQMHLARGMCRAVARGDFDLATVFFDRLHGIPRPTKGGA